MDEPEDRRDLPGRLDDHDPVQELEIALQPTVPDQELDTRATTGVIYWEGSQRRRRTRAGSFVGGQAYVELTGYANSSSGASAFP